MRVMIEASEAYRNTSGIRRFSRELIAHLPPDVDVVFSPADYMQRAHVDGRRTLAQRVKHLAGHMALTQVEVARAASRERASVIHSLSFFVPLMARQPVVATIFDLAYLDLPAHTDRFWGEYARRLMPVFAHRAAAIITTSQVMKAKIEWQLGVSPDRVHCVYAGVPPEFTVITDTAYLAALRHHYGLETPFVLFSGAWNRNKNLDGLFQAFSRVTGVTLALTGIPDLALLALAERLRVRVNTLGYVPDADLPGLYNLASVVVLPSRYEGFGLPVLEAMACGTPIITSNIPVLAEVAGGASPTFPVDSPEMLANLISQLMADRDARALWRQKGLARAAGFRWHAAAAQVVHIWETVSAS